MVPHSGTSGADSAAVIELVTRARELVWQCCLLAQERSPGSVSYVPVADDLAAAHHAMSRTATACAQVAQTLVMAPGPDAPARAAASALACAEEALAALGC